MELYEAVLAADALRLTMTVKGYERAHAEHESDLNWLRSEVRIVAGETSAGFECSFTTGELADLAHELHALLSSAADEVNWESEELDLSLRLQMQRTGRVHVEGMAKRQQGIGTTLAFSAEVDRSQVDEFRSGLAGALTRFPSRVPRDSLYL
jgi:hypothetical protein